MKRKRDPVEQIVAAVAQLVHVMRTHAYMDSRFPQQGVRDLTCFCRPRRRREGANRSLRVRSDRLSGRNPPVRPPAPVWGIVGGYRVTTNGRGP